MNKKTLGAIIIGIIIMGGGIIIATSEGAAAPTTDTMQTPITNETSDVSQDGTTTDITTSAQKSYTLAEVAAHSDKASCWTTVNGNVYDLTLFVGKHPGGEAKIISICGKDGTEAFTDQHGGQRRPEKELASLLIGTLAK